MKVYYYNTLSDEQVSPDAPEDMEGRTVMRLASMILKEKGSFIGFVDSQGTNLQFYSDGINDILLDIPTPEKSGSYQTKVDQKTAMELILTLEEPFAALIVSRDLKLVPWRFA
jgi:hypothetical protein